MITLRFILQIKIKLLVKMFNDNCLKQLEEVTNIIEQFVANYVTHFKNHLSVFVKE